ncbi:Tropinesterase [Pigmentiphaga humi]|uniref:Tropinesterase n=1 Tax=Pigmentiphaga humi TaxID=2478468 RepID=A0A3P4AWK8_9BURK|nr:alpha/beta hydrolase [Pigmentiphaga humi]VCU68427.1 Tropinesterase [Pigmentiphaga humi]
METRDYRVPANGLELHVTEWGPADGRPVLMLHGIRGYAQTFHGLAQALPDRRVIAYDQRGRGLSDWDPAREYYTASYVADLDAVATQLGLGRFDLLGHSMGGIAAIVYAATHPGKVDRMVIEDAGPDAFEHSSGAGRIRAELTNAPLSFESFDHARAFMRALRPSVTEEAREERLRNMLQVHPDGSCSWRYDHAGIAQARLDPLPGHSVDLWPHVKALACPTLVLRGGRSDYLSADTALRMADANPHIRWSEVPDAGHYVHDDQPELVAQAVRAFLAG